MGLLSPQVTLEHIHLCSDLHEVHVVGAVMGAFKRFLLAVAADAYLFRLTAFPSLSASTSRIFLELYIIPPL